MTEQTKELNAWSDSPEEKEASVKSGAGGNIVNYKMIVGENLIRVVGTYKFFLEHWFNKVKRSAVCPGKGCPMCNHPQREKAKQAAEASAKKLGKEHKDTKAAWRRYFSYEPGMKYALNVIDRKEHNMKVWKFSRTMKECVESIVKKYGDPTTYDLIVERRGTTKENTKYTILPAPDKGELSVEEKKLQPLQLGIIYKASSTDKIAAYVRGELPVAKQEQPTEVAVEPEISLPPGLEDEINVDEISDIEVGEI